MIILLLLLISSVCLAQEDVIKTTGTTDAVKLTQPTTYQVLLEKSVNPAITDSGKITAISLLLTDNQYYKSLCGVDIDVVTGQVLADYKYMLEEEIRNRKLGRNYSAGKTFPIFKVKK